LARTLYAPDLREFANEESAQINSNDLPTPGSHAWSTGAAAEGATRPSGTAG
jgi:hypothetical protein